VATPGRGVARTLARKGAMGLAMAYPAQPFVAPSKLTMPVVTLGQPALVMEFPTLTKAGAAVVTLLHRKESRSAAMHSQQGWRAPAPEALAPLGPALAAAKKRASRLALEKPLAIELGPTTTAEEELGPAIP
jgi:hypothetical protein